MKQYTNILVVRTDRIGDVILTTPAITALRRSYPQARITLLVAPALKEIVEDNPSLNEVIVDDRTGANKGFFGFMKLMTLLRKKRFDLAVVFHTKKRTNLLCFLAGIPTRIGYKNNKFGFLLTAQVKDTRPRGDKHEAEYCLDLVRHLGVDARDLTLSISIKQTHEDWVQQFLNDSGVAASGQLIAVHPGASCISKRWPAKNFAALMNAVTEKYPFNIVLIGNSSNRFIADEIKQAVPRPVIDAVGKTSVGQLASLLKRCALLVSNDSGPVHVASAVGTPVISIFGRNQAGLSPARWRPLGKDAMVFHKEVGCGVCLAHNCAIGFLCLEKITPGEVMEAVTALLSSNNRMP